MFNKTNKHDFSTFLFENIKKHNFCHFSRFWWLSCISIKSSIQSLKSQNFFIQQYILTYSFFLFRNKIHFFEIKYKKKLKIDQRKWIIKIILKIWKKCTVSKKLNPNISWYYNPIKHLKFHECVDSSTCNKNIKSFAPIRKSRESHKILRYM